jgi:lipooligosaccharide transport system permease protein
MTSPAAVRVMGRQVALFKRTWQGSLLVGFLQPLLFLAGMGLGVGSLVTRSQRNSDVLGGVSYVSFIAPALLASTAMMIAAAEAMWPVMDGLKWTRSYEAMLSTPLRVSDLVRGQALWWAVRVASSSVAVAFGMLLFRDARSTGLLLAVPAAVLCGLAFSLPIGAISTLVPRESAFPAIQRFVIVPLFLFGGVFYPIGQLPGWLQVVAKVTPLYHGVQLCRGFTTHTLAWIDAAGHTAVLLAYIAAGWVLCHRCFDKRLRV